MHIEELETQIQNIQTQLENLDPNSNTYQTIQRQVYDLQKQVYDNLSAWDRVTLARAMDRPKASDYIDRLFTNFLPLHGDRCFKDDSSIITGIAYFDDIPVTVIAESKGKNLQENMKNNFGMVSPEGYRKALRIAKLSEKFNRPIITFVDTPGAYPGKGAEERGQAEAIAQCLYTFSDLKVPVIAIVISEGGSGGALALSVADRIIMLENAVYSILSPEGFASILWKDETRAKEAASVMKLTSYDLKKEGIIDTLIKEPMGGAQKCFPFVIDQLSEALRYQLNELRKKKTTTLLNERYNKYRNLGVPTWKM